MSETFPRSKRFNALRIDYKFRKTILDNFSFQKYFCFCPRSSITQKGNLLRTEELSVTKWIFSRVDWCPDAGKTKTEDLKSAKSDIVLKNNDRNDI